MFYYLFDRYNRRARTGPASVSVPARRGIQPPCFGRFRHASVCPGARWLLSPLSVYPEGTKRRVLRPSTFASTRGSRTTWLLSPGDGLARDAFACTSSRRRVSLEREIKLKHYWLKSVYMEEHDVKFKLLVIVFSMEY